MWLGHDVEVLDERGQPYQTTEGTVGETEASIPQDRIRLTWQPKDWDHDTTVQVAVTPNGPGRTMLRFHQERLTSTHEREQQRTHWRAVLADAVDAVDAIDSSENRSSSRRSQLTTPATTAASRPTTGTFSGIRTDGSRCSRWPTSR